MEIEFHCGPDGTVFYRIDNGDNKKLTRFNKDIIDKVLALLNAHFTDTKKALEKLYPLKNKSDSAKILQNYLIAERFIRCNFGEDDILFPDINNGFFHFEKVKCPLRGGFCPFEDIICSPKGTGCTKLSSLEKQVASLYVEGITYKEIAVSLNKKPNTIKTVLNRIKTKLKLKSSRSIIKEVKLNNLI